MRTVAATIAYWLRQIEADVLNVGHYVKSSGFLYQRVSFEVSIIF